MPFVKGEECGARTNRRIDSGAAFEMPYVSSERWLPESRLLRRVRSASLTKRAEHIDLRSVNRYSIVRIGAPTFLRNTTTNFAGFVLLAFLPTT